MVNPNVRLTYQDYVNLPESDDKRYELIDGELYLVPSPTPAHQTSLQNLFKKLDDFVQSGRLGRVFVAPLDVVLSNEDVLQPDILYISSRRENIITEINIQGAPDLVVEILSPGTADRDRTIKRARYFVHGVQEYWMVDPQAKTIEVLTAGQDDFETVGVYAEGTSLASPTLEGLVIQLQGIFSRA